jgi:hypothetical protein
MTSRSTLLLLFFALLHALVLGGMWRGSDGRIADGVVLFSAVPLLLAGGYLLGRFGEPMTWLDAWVMVYGAWSTASIVLFAQPGNPSQIGAYAYGIYNFVLPIACIFAAKSLNID